MQWGTRNMATEIRERVRTAAERVLAKEKSIGPLELMVGLGFLHFTHMNQWKGGSPHYQDIQSQIQCGEKKLKTVYAEFFAWVSEKKLESFKAEYLCASRDGSQQLQVSADGDPEKEDFFRTHFRSADLTAKQKERIEKKQNKAPDLVVFQLTGESSKCEECSIELERGEMFLLEKKLPLCLTCADLDHLQFLPSGNATLTRRARKHSPLSAIVTRFDRRRKRYQRQGILVTTAAIDAAHAQNESDADKRARLRERAAERREQQDVELVREMTELILAEFPGCPVNEAEEIASHTAERGSGRVGRSAAGRELDPKAISLAVNAWIRHQHTDYDTLLMQGVERMTARDQISDAQQTVREQWKSPNKQ